MIRSRAASKSLAAITSRLPRTATMAASFARLARSAPENPGVPLATAPRSTSGASHLPWQCTIRIAARSFTSGKGIVTCRSNRPGRRRAGSRTSGRLVAASTTMLITGSKPSISASSWFSVCSRSSLATSAPWPARRCPIASISSMKMMAGARLRLCEQVTYPGRADPDETSPRNSTLIPKRTARPPRRRPPGRGASCRCRAGLP